MILMMRMSALASSQSESYCSGCSENPVDRILCPHLMTLSGIRNVRLTFRLDLLANTVTY